MLIRTIFQGLRIKFAPYRTFASGRVIESYSRNTTASLSLKFPSSLERVPSLKFAHVARYLKIIEDNREQIVEHGARRADLFFYQMLSLFHLNKNKVNTLPIQITKERTRLQFGRGSNLALTQACHSSLFPHIKILAKSLDGFRINLTEKYIQTHFYQSLNSTIELPFLVNCLNGRLEGRRKQSTYVLECLDILNRVANDEIDPRGGMNLFYAVMHRFFVDTRNYYVMRQNLHESALIKLAILEFERKGVFHGANAGLKMLDDYLFLLLRLTQGEIQQVKQDPARLRDFYQGIHDEIWRARRGLGTSCASGLRPALCAPNSSILTNCHTSGQLD